MQKLRAQFHLAGINLIEAALAFLPADNIAPVKTINQHFLPIFTVMLEQKMSWKAHTCQQKTDAARHFHVYDRERDGNSQTAVKHVIQERIAGIIIIVAITAKIQALKQDPVERRESVLRVCIRRERG